MSTSPELSPKAQKLLQAVQHFGGGAIAEEDLQAFTRLSHGSLLAARHELMEKGILAMGRAHGKPAFVLLCAVAASETPNSTSADTSADARSTASATASEAPQASEPAALQTQPPTAKKSESAGKSQAAGGEATAPAPKTPAGHPQSQAVRMAKAKPAAMTGHKVSADAAPAKKAPRAKEGRERIEAFASVKPSLPRVTGEFADLDDWNDALVAELGDVDISPSVVSDTEYIVYAHKYEQEDRYEVTETEDGLLVE